MKNERLLQVAMLLVLKQPLIHMNELTKIQLSELTSQKLLNSTTARLLLEQVVVVAHVAAEAR